MKCRFTAYLCRIAGITGDNALVCITIPAAMEDRYKPAQCYYTTSVVDESELSVRECKSISITVDY